MDKKIKKILAAILVVCLLLTLVPLHATSLPEESDLLSTLITENESSTGSNASIENGNNLESELPSEDEEENLKQKILLTSLDDETEQPENDNWELSLNFYDRKNGIIEERKINWDASNGSYEQSAEKEIILQVNYVNKDIQKNYDIGELTIKIPNLMFGCEESQIKTDIKITANTINQSGYKWDYILDDFSNNDEFFVFTNAEEIAANTVGSFQIDYTIYFTGDNEEINNYGQKKSYPEKFEDSCYELFESTTYASLNDEIKTDALSIKFERTYIHPWSEQKFSIEESTAPFICPDGIIDNKNDYIWVCYKYHIPESDYTNNLFYPEYKSTYPNYRNKSFKMKTSFPEKCIVMDSDFNIFVDNNIQLTNFETDNNYKISDNILYVGYPRAIYNEENNNYIVNNSVDLYVDYEFVGEKYNYTSEATVNLGKFALNYDGGPGDSNFSVYIYENSNRQQLYEYMSTNSDSLYSLSAYNMPIQSVIFGMETDVVVGMDKIFITGSDNEYRVLCDDEYCIQNIYFPQYIRDRFKKDIPANTYDIELWVREKNKKDYYLLDTFKNPENAVGYSPENVVAFYFKIKGVKNGDGISTTGNNDEQQWAGHNIRFLLKVNNADIAKDGSMYIFDYLKIYEHEKDNLLNPAFLRNYEGLARTMLAPLDIENHGNYIYRNFTIVDYSSIGSIKSMAALGTKKEMNIDSQDDGNEKFNGTATIHLTKGIGHEAYFNKISDISIINDSEKIKGFEIWDLLPYGMALESTEDEIRETISSINSYYYQLYLNDMPTNGENIQKKFKSCFNIDVVENWKGTGRTLIHIKLDLGNDNMILRPTIYMEQDYLSLQYKFSISYDAFMENSTYTNDVYADWITNKFYLQNTVVDDGSADIDAIDINENGITDENLAHALSSLTINSMVACQQDIKKYVQTDRKNFTTKEAESSLDSEYQYKIAINTGPTEVTNLVIYDNIETEFGQNQYWQGEFIGVDTSYAKSKGYQVEVYYSNKADADRIENDNSWKLLTDETPKQDVKSLAFKYLDKDGNSAKLPTNEMTYVLIKMKSPERYNLNKTYNKARVEWNAIDSFGNAIDDIVGLNSNIVKVNLPKPVNIKFSKILDGDNENYDRLKLNKENDFNFLLTITNQETNEIIQGHLSSKNGLLINGVIPGTYIVKESDDIWFNFVGMVLLEQVEGVDFKKENGNYILTIGINVESGVTIGIDITNKPKDERYYNNKYSIKNLFTPII